MSDIEKEKEQAVINREVKFFITDGQLDFGHLYDTIEEAREWLQGIQKMFPKAYIYACENGERIYGN